MCKIVVVVAYLNFTGCQLTRQLRLVATEAAVMQLVAMESGTALAFHPETEPPLTILFPREKCHIVSLHRISPYLCKTYRCGA